MCVCLYVCVGKSESVCDELHVTVCDPWLCLFLYIVLAIRIGHDLKQIKSVHAVFLASGVPNEHLSPSYINLTRYFCQLLECGDNPETIYGQIVLITA